MAESHLREHVYSAAHAACTATRLQYAQRGIADHANTACAEIQAHYFAMLGAALNDDTPDWRNSDGLRGYADRTVTIMTRESLELS
jgi:hypothetical protein